MFGLPGQTLEQALDDIRIAIEQQPTHLSVYQLTIEPNTLFHAKPPVLPDDDATWNMQQALQARWQRTVTGSMKSRPMPNPAASADTTLTTGSW